MYLLLLIITFCFLRIFALADFGKVAFAVNRCEISCVRSVAQVRRARRGLSIFSTSLLTYGILSNRLFTDTVLRLGHAIPRAAEIQNPIRQ